MLINTVGILILLLHYLVTTKKSIKRLLTFCDISLFMVASSFILNNPIIGQYALLFSINALIGKTVLLGRYTVHDLQDFVLHYFGIIATVYWLYALKTWKVSYINILLIGLVIFGLHFSYYKITNLYVYRSIPINKINGVLKYIVMMLMLLSINFIIKKNSVIYYK
jgi:hypothetical protein